MKRILVTGGAGYIGSHTVLQLLEQGYEVVVVDNLSNSSRESLKRVESITGKGASFYAIDILDVDALRQVFATHPFDAVIHFAGLKAVGESVQHPLTYYHNNVVGTLRLVQVMTEFEVNDIVFSSSATVYGDPNALPIHEDMPTGATTNPYGTSKHMVERILADHQAACQQWNVVILRYFNPVGAHPSGLIGEDPNGIPNNLMPFISQTAMGKRDKLRVFGNDYDTTDGTGVRDYIHVVDLAAGHLKSLERLEQKQGYEVFNLGTGVGYSVLDMVKAFEAASQQQVPYEIVERRPGDIAACYADPTLARDVLGWEAKLNLDDMCNDAWRWQSNNPDGYAS